MKKITILFLLVIVAVSCLSSCQEKNPYIDNTEYGAECETQNKYLLINSTGFQEVGKAFIGTAGMVGRYIRFYDPDSKVSDVLCSDPSCMHDSNTCSAYVNSGQLSYYDNKIYYISSDSENYLGDWILWKEDVSGNNKTKVKEISLEDIILKYQPQRIVLHHGKVYMLGIASTVEGAKPEYRISLLATPIDNSSDYQILVDKTISSGVSTSGRFIGDHVYFMIKEVSQDNNEVSVTVMCFSTVDGKEETVYKETGITDKVADFWVTDSEEILLAGIDENDHPCIWKLSSNKRESVVIWEDIKNEIPMIMEDIASVSYYVDETRHISIKDFSDNTVYSGPLFVNRPEGAEKDLGTRDYGFAVVGGDANKMIINLIGFNNDRKSYTILFDLNNDMKPTLLWNDGN